MAVRSDDTILPYAGLPLNDSERINYCIHSDFYRAVDKSGIRRHYGNPALHQSLVLLPADYAFGPGQLNTVVNTMNLVGFLYSHYGYFMPALF